MGKTLATFEPGSFVPPTTNYATRDWLAAATGLRALLDFDSATAESAESKTRVMPGGTEGYDGTSGLTLTVFGSMDTANTGTKVVKINAQIERVQTGDALGAAGNDFASAQSVEATVDNTAGNRFVGAITFTNAQADGIQPGETFRLRIQRAVSGLSGTNATGDFQLEAAELKVT